MNDLEREAIILDSAWKMIDGMVNWAMFVRVELREPTNLTFHDDEHAKLFVILLRDFLSQVRAHGSQPSRSGCGRRLQMHILQTEPSSTISGKSAPNRSSRAMRLSSDNRSKRLPSGWKGNSLRAASGCPTSMWKWT